MTLTKLTMRGAGWQLLSVVTQAALQLVVLAVMARRIGPEAFGLFAIAGIPIAMALIFSEVGIGPAVVQRKDLTQRHIRAGFTISVCLGAIVWCVLWLVAPLIAALFKSAPVTGLLRIASFSFTAAGFGVVAQSLLERELRFRKLMMIDLTSYVAGYATVGITMAVTGYGAWSLVGAVLGQSFIRSSLLLLVSRHRAVPLASRSVGSDAPVCYRTIFKELFAFGGGLTLSRICNYAALQADFLVVGRWMGPTALGFYERANRIMTLPGSMLGNVLDKVMFPAMSRIQDERQRLGENYLRAVSLTHLCLIPASLTLLVVAPELVRVVLGPQWGATVLPLRILLLGVSLRASVRICDSLVRAVGAVYGSAVRKAIYLAVVAVASFAGLRWGLPGVAVGVTVAAALNFAIMAAFCLSLTGQTWRSLLAAQAPGVRMGAIVLAASVPIYTALRSVECPPVLTLPVTCLCAALAGVAAALLRPALVGPHALGIAKQALEFLPHPQPHPTEEELLSELEWIAGLLEREGIHYWVDSGTLLGLVRDGAPLPNDWDIDISVWDTEIDRLTQFLPSLCAAGYRLRRETYRGSVYKYKLIPRARGLTIDVNIFRERDGYAWCPAPAAIANPHRRGTALYYALGAYRRILHCYWDWFVLSGEITSRMARANYVVGTWWIPTSYLRDTAPYGDLGLAAPRELEAYLKLRYGNWKQPVSNWNYWTDDGAVDQRPPVEVTERLLERCA